MKICVTGHRPDKLYGYDLSNIKWKKLKDLFKEILKDKNCNEAITGMALGVDTVFALAVLELKKEGIDIKLHCAIPCRNQSKKWTSKDKKMYDYILSKADIVNIVSNEEYKPYLMQKRNSYMVNLSDFIIAVWSGDTNSGTYNCIRYANKQKKPILIINTN